MFIAARYVLPLRKAGMPYRSIFPGSRSIAIGIAVLAIAAPALAAPASARESTELRAVERAWDDAVVRRDGAALERILADDFVLVWIDGRKSGKRALIAAVMSRKAEIDPFETEGVEIRLYGRTAVVTGRFTQTARLGERAETNSFAYSDVYVRSAGGWRAVSAHASLIGRPKP